MNSYDRILVEENEKKPNRNVAKVMLVITFAVLMIAILNELNFFYVSKDVMRITFIIVVIAAVISSFIGFNEKLATNSLSKYTMMTILMAVVLIVNSMMDQFTTLIIVFPFLLGYQYHDRGITLYTIIGVCIISLTSAPLGWLLGTWQVDYYEYLLELMGHPVKELEIITNYQTGDSFIHILKYISLPRFLLVLSFSYLFFTGTKTSSDNVRHRAEALYQAETDSLTKLYNRGKFDAVLLEDSRKTMNKFSCIYCDANGLHEINDSKGHVAGDLFLCACADSISRHFADQLCFRTGGDEFVVLTEGMLPNEISVLIMQVQDELRQKGYSLSMGYQYEECCKDLAMLVKQAEQAMYADKKKYYETTGIDRRRHSN